MDLEFRSRLAAILQQTYQGSLDCPVLDRARDLNDVLDGYAARGDGGTAGWFLIERKRFAGPPLGEEIAIRQAKIKAAEVALEAAS